MKRITKRVLSTVLGMVVMFTAVIGSTNLTWARVRVAEITVEYRQSEARSMFSAINEFRLSNPWAWNETNTKKEIYTGLRELDYDYELEKIAMKRAAEIAVYYSHTRPNGERCFTAYEEITNHTYGWKGENIAYGYNCFKSADEVFEAWAEENEYYSGQGHRRNMISPNFTTVGIGYCRYNGKEYWVQEFGSPSSETGYVEANNAKTDVQMDVDESIDINALGGIYVEDKNKDNFSDNNNQPIEDITTAYSGVTIDEFTGAFKDIRTGKETTFNARDDKAAVYIFGGVGSCGITTRALYYLSKVLKNGNFSDVNFYLIDCKDNNDETIISEEDYFDKSLHVADSATSRDFRDFYWQCWDYGEELGAILGAWVMLPVVVYKDANNRVINVTTGECTEKIFIDNLIKISNDEAFKNMPDNYDEVTCKNIYAEYKDGYLIAGADFYIPAWKTVEYDLSYYDSGYRYRYFDNSDVYYKDGKITLNKRLDKKLKPGKYTFQICLYINNDSDYYYAEFEVKEEECVHKYDARYDWNTDNTKCTLTLSCAYCGHEEKRACKVTNTTKKATSTSKGKITYTATTYLNGKAYSTTKNTTINPIKTVVLSSSSVKYDGRIHKPAVYVKDKAGKTISSSYYTVTYLYKNKKASPLKKGIYTVQINFKTRYSGTKSLKFKIR